MLLTSKPRETIPAGTHTAVLYQLIDLGTQRIEYQGEMKIQPKIRLVWELSEEKMEDGRPFSIGKKYTFSANPKAKLVQDIKSWTGQEVGKDFPVESLLGKPCNITVVHNVKTDGSISPSIAGIAPLKKSEKAPSLVNQIVLFEMSPPDRFNQDIFGKLPDFIQTDIKASPEFIEAVNAMNSQPKVNVPELNDDLDF